MANTPKYLLNTISDISEIRGFHHQCILPDNRLAGLEEEIFIHDQGENMPMATHEQNLALEGRLLHDYPPIECDSVSLEPGAHMMEAKTDAWPGNMQSAIIDQIKLRRSNMLVKARRTGLIRSPYSTLPHVSEDEALGNMIQRIQDKPERGDRQISLVEVFKQSSLIPAPQYPVYSVGEQYTHGATNLEDLLKTKRAFYAISALIYNIFDNSSPFIGGEKQDVHPVIDLRLLVNKHMGSPIDKIIFEAENGEDYIERKIQATLDKPLMVEHDIRGNYLELEEEEQITVRKRLEEGKATKLLYLMAQLQEWPFQKDKLFHSEEEGFHSIGNEIRDLGNGPGAPSIAVALFTPIAFNPDFRDHLMGVLEQKYGISLLSDPVSAYEVIMDNFSATHQRVTVEGTDPSLFLNAPFGNKGHTQIQFMREDLIPMLKQVHSHDAALYGTLSPLEFIAKTGLTDTQFYHDTQPALQDTLDFMDPRKGYDDRIFMNCDKTIAQLYVEGRLPQVKAENTKVVNERIAKANLQAPAQRTVPANDLFDTEKKFGAGPK